MDNKNVSTLAPPVADPAPAPPQGERLVTPELLYLNQGTTYRLGSAFAGTANPSSVWQQMIDDAPTAMMYYRELQAKDDDIGAAIAEVKLSVMKRGYQIVPGDDSSTAAQAAEFCKAQIEGLANWRTVLKNLMDAPFYGYTIAELMFDTSMGQAGLSDVVDVPQELFSFNPAMYPQVGALRLKEYFGSLDGKLVEEQKFLVFTSEGRHGNRMGSPILREIYWASWFKRNCQRFWLRLAERGPGTAVVTHEDGATPDEKRNALRAAQALVEEVYVAVPKSFQVLTELLQGTRAADPATYEKLYNVLESKIYRRIVGSTLTSHGSDGGKGTQALGTVHQETKEERSIELCLDTAAVINTQLFRTLTLWNFGPDCATPKLQFNVEEKKDVPAIVDSADKLQNMGLPIPKAWAYEQAGIPVPEAGDEILVRAVAPAAAGPVPPADPERPEFSAAQQRQVEHDVRELDKLFDQLRADALKETAKRVDALTEGVERANVIPGR